MSSHEGAATDIPLQEVIARGGTILTSTQRLSRELRSRHDAHMLRQGGKAWPAPNILPYSSWLSRIVEEHVLFEDALSTGGRHLLTPSQERLTWELALTAAGMEDAVLQTEALSTMMMDAYTLEHRWLLGEEDMRQAGSEGTAAYLLVRAQVRRIWEEKGLLPASVLPRTALALLREHPALLPETLLLAGFDLLPDAATLAFTELYQRHRGNLQYAAAPRVQGKTRFLCYEHFDDEVHAAAQWSREHLERGATNIAVVFPSLDRIRGTVERIFRDVLAPETTSGARDTETAYFELSLGTRCADEPVMAAAFHVLDLLRPKIPVDAISALLRSPFVQGSRQHRASRMRAELHLRRTGVEDLRPKDLLRALDTSETGDGLPGVLCAERVPSGRRSAMEWGKEIEELLQALGWPGEETLTSREYQAVHRWERLMDEFVSFDAVLQPMTSTEMLARVRRMLTERVFQPETRNAPVQVMGMLETAGLQFAHCRVAGMNEEQWPPPARVHPFIPLGLQRSALVTDAVPERYLEQMRTVTRRVQGLAPALLFTCSRSDGDREILPSPLLRHIPLENADITSRSYARSMQRRYPEDLAVRPVDRPPALAADEIVRGGVRVLTLQAACHFRAFAELRLHADEPEIAEAGVRPLDRGNVLHGVLERVWEDLGSQAGLLALGEQELQHRIAHAIDATERSKETMRSARYPDQLRAAERTCLQNIVTEWMTLERARPPFTVVSREESREGDFASLRLRLRIDRIDRLQDGSLLLIDYKTSLHRPSEWMEARPAEPQLPMYTMTNAEDVGAASFAVLRRGESRFSGVARAVELAPMLQDAEQFLEKRDDGIKDWESMLASWREVLTALAMQFAEGSAEVNPRDDAETCRYCRLHAFCRIDEMRKEERNV